MKKVILLLVSLVFCFGCSAPSKEDQQFELYNQLKKELIVHKDMDQDIPCRISLIFNPLENEYRYDIVIDQVQEDMYDIMAIAYANEDEEQLCPTIGLFDEETYSLKVNYINKPAGFYKGIQLSGKCDQKQAVKLYIRYFTDEKREKSVEKYIEVKENEIR